MHISCILRAYDCHLCVYNLGPGTVSSCAWLILKGQCLRIGLSYSSQGGQWDLIVERQPHGAILLLKAEWRGKENQTIDTWRRTKGSHRLQQKGRAAQLAGIHLPTRRRDGGEDLKSKGWPGEVTRATKHWWSSEDVSSAFECAQWALCGLVCCLGDSPEGGIGGQGNGPGCGWAWIMTLMRVTEAQLRSA